MVLAKHLDGLIRRRFAIAVEFGQTSFARCHVKVLPDRNVPTLVLFPDMTLRFHSQEIGGRFHRHN